MARQRKNVTLKGYDDLFSSEESRKEEQREKVQEIPLSELYPFKDHPFRVVEDEAMLRTVESVVQYGVIVPVIARPREDGGYELISGHRRKRAAELAGLTTLPVIVRDLDDDSATVLMVDSNLQREHILPSERAWAYRMKLEALSHQGRRADLTSGQLGPKLQCLRSNQQVAVEAGESVKQVQRYIRLTYLLPDIVDLVDNGKLAFNTAVELSYLNDQQQFDLLDAMAESQNLPSLSQAQRMKQMSREDTCTPEALMEIMAEIKKPPEDRVTLKGDTLRKFFPKNYSPQQMEQIILKLLKQWQKKRQRGQEL